MVVYHLLLCSWLMLSWIISSGSAEKRSYMTYDMGTICKTHPSFRIKMHHSGTGSTGILKAKDYLSEDEEKECVALIRPPRGYGVVFHLENVKLRKDANFDCRDYIKIYNETARSNSSSPLCRDCCKFKGANQVCGGRCGYESDGMVCEEYCDKNNASFPYMGIGRSLVLHYRTRCGSCTDMKEKVGFRMIFTAYRLTPAGEAPCVWPSDFQCDNGRCIWSGLTCDGRNNCGDMSDENLAGSSHCGGFPDPIKAAVVASAVIATVLLGIVLAYFPKLKLRALLRKKRKDAAFRLAQRNSKCKNDANATVAVKPGPSRSISNYPGKLPKIKENPDETPHAESEA